MLLHCQTLGVSDEKGEQVEQTLGVTQGNSFQGSQKTSHASTQVSSSALLPMMCLYLSENGLLT